MNQIKNNQKAATMAVRIWTVVHTQAALLLFTVRRVLVVAKMGTEPN